MPRKYAFKNEKGFIICSVDFCGIDQVFKCLVLFPSLVLVLTKMVWLNKLRGFLIVWRFDQNGVVK